MKGVPLSGKATVDALGDQWAKILAIIMLKHGIMDTTLTLQDCEALGKDGSMDYSLVPGPGGNEEEIRIRVMKTGDAIEEARKHKGGFGRSCPPRPSKPFLRKPYERTGHASEQAMSLLACFFLLYPSYSSLPYMGHKPDFRISPPELRP